MSKGRFLHARAFKTARRTSGHITISSTTGADVDTGLDLTLLAEVGDVVWAFVNCRYQAAAVYLFMDAFSVVAGSPVNPFGAGLAGSTEGVPSWFGDGSSSAVNWTAGGSVRRTIVSGDLASGYLTARLRAKVNTGSRQIYANADMPFEWALFNTGPPDPN